MDTEAILAVAVAALGHPEVRCEDSGAAVRVFVGDTVFDITYSGSVTRTQQEVEDAVAAACSSSDAMSATARLSSFIDLLVEDMTQPHEGIPHGVPSNYAWYSDPGIGSATCPDGWTAMQQHGVVYVDATAADSGAPNTRFEIGELDLRTLSAAAGKWTTHRWATVTGRWYAEINHPGDSSVDSDMAVVSTSPLHVSATAGNGYIFHFYPSTRTPIDGADIAGVIVTIRARLIVADANEPDDRASSRYMLAPGADWKIDLVTPPSTETNLGVALGRFKYITSEWQLFTMTTLTREQLEANPP